MNEKQNREKSSRGPIDIEDLKEQGVRSDSVGSKTPVGDKRKDDKFEFAKEISDLRKAFTNLRDLDVDAMGKDKSGFDYNFWRRK